MAGLYSQLYLGASALGAQRTGVAAAGHNIANVNTPGHTRVEIDLRANEAFVGGVISFGYSSTADNILDNRERTVDAELGRARNLAASSMALEGALAIEGGSIVDAIAALFGGIIELSSNPTDIALRQAALSDATALTTEFGRAARAIDQAQSGADDRLVSLAQEASRLAQEIADANQALSSQQDTTLIDRRNLAARQLAQLVGGSAHIDDRGSMRFALENGIVLVDGDTASQVEAVRDQANYGNHMRIDVVASLGRTDVTRVIQQGRIGAELDFRDNVSAQLMSDLDQLAYDLATELNAVHRNHAGLDGISGRDLFVPPSQVTGAASQLALDPGVLADPAQLAGADPNLGPGDNSGLMALIALKDASLAGPGQSQNFLDEGLRMLTSLGFTVQRANNASEVASLRADALAEIRDSVSGVSVEEELTRLQAYQRASEATTRVLSTVDNLLGTLIERL